MHMSQVHAYEHSALNQTQRWRLVVDLNFEIISLVREGSSLVGRASLSSTETELPALSSRSQTTMKKPLC